MNPLGNGLYWILAILVASAGAMLASFAGGYLYPWLGIGGAVIAAGFVIFAFYVLSTARYS